MKIIAVANQKGGCGKTTTAINLSACLGKKEKRVLLLDLDPQGHSSLGFGVYDEDAKDLYDVFTGETVIDDVILPNVFTGVDVLPATQTLAAAEHLPVRKDERDLQLAKHLALISDHYDFVVIDCPPSMGLLSFNALAVAHLVLVPIEMSLFGLHGIDSMYEVVRALQERHGREVPIRVLPTLVDSRTRLCRQFLHEVGERYADDVLPVMVQFTVRLKESVRQGVPIVDFDPASTVAVQYDRLANELQSILMETVPDPSDHEGDAHSRLTSMKRAFEDARSRLSGKPNRQFVVLRFYDFAGCDLKIAGSFNDWRPDEGVATQIDDDGVIEKTLFVSPGTYQYRLVVDGVWQEDPSNPEQLPNFSGGFNSVLEVEEELETADA